MNIALILSAGVGKRFDDDLPKQYQLLNQKQVIAYVIDTAKNTHLIDKLIVVSHESYCDSLASQYDVEVIKGGDNRNKSIKNGLDHIYNNYDCKKIVILDAVRPFIRSELLTTYMQLLDIYDVIATAKKITDSLSSYDFHIVDRDRYFLLSSPEAFRFDLLYYYLDGASPLMEITQQLPEGTNMYLYFEYVNDLKITYKHDLHLAQLMLQGKGFF
jgi:2-C-methyl-D-erythritol 4-phosphate cytidylyltransferase